MALPSGAWQIQGPRLLSPRAQVQRPFSRHTCDCAGPRAEGRDPSCSTASLVGGASPWCWGVRTGGVVCVHARVHVFSLPPVFRVRRGLAAQAPSLGHDFDGTLGRRAGGAAGLMSGCLSLASGLGASAPGPGRWVPGSQGSSEPGSSSWSCLTSTGRETLLQPQGDRDSVREAPWVVKHLPVRPWSPWEGLRPRSRWELCLGLQFYGC